MPRRTTVTGADVLKGLSENDVALLREMAAAYRNTIVNPRLRPVVPPSDKQTPETYIVLTPPGGIPALSETDDLLTGTGTGSESPTADNPGSAECRIFQRFALTNELQDLGFTEVVYNLSLAAVPGNSFALATRTKEGDLQAVTGGGSGNVSITYGGAGCPGLADDLILATHPLTCDIYRLGNAPPAAPDVAGVICWLMGDYQCGLSAGQTMSSGYRFDHIMLVPLDTDIRDAYDSGLTAFEDMVAIPHGNEEAGTGTGTGTGEEDDAMVLYRVRFVERTAWGTHNDMKRVYLAKDVTAWPTTNI